MGKQLSAGRSYRGIEILDTWPAAAYIPGAVVDRQDPEHYEAFIGQAAPFRRVAGRTLAAIRSEIRAALEG